MIRPNLDDEAIRLAVEHSLSVEVNLEAQVAEIAKLSIPAYEQVRASKARELRMRLSVLDNEVEKLRSRTTGRLAQAANLRSLAPPPPDPWPETVEGAALLDGVYKFVKRFVVLDKCALDALVLWVAFTYFFEIAETSPRLRVKSPDKRCGKTRLLELLGFLIPRSITASNMSSSAIFRTIATEQCALFIDEADTFLRENEELRGLLNSGHARASAYVIRSVPAADRTWEQKRFSTWCPMAIAGIGKLPDTIEDRSIAIVMRRKLRGDKVERLTRRNTIARQDAETLASKLARFAAEHLPSLRDAEPSIPDALSDRAADNWEHLLAIADLAGDDWPSRARVAALTLSGGKDGADEDSLRTRLLSDIRGLLKEHPQNEMSSADLCKALIEIETAPWSELNRGKAMTPARLSRMLKDFEIYVGKVHSGKARGYRKSDFADAFERYLSSVPSTQGVQVSEALGRERESTFTEVFGADTLKMVAAPTETKTLDTLTVSEGGISASHARKSDEPSAGRERHIL